MTTTDHNANYKARKEAFVSNLSGGSITEINLVTLVAPVWSLTLPHNPTQDKFPTDSGQTGCSITMDCIAEATVLLYTIRPHPVRH